MKTKRSQDPHGIKTGINIADKTSVAVFFTTAFLIVIFLYASQKQAPSKVRNPETASKNDFFVSFTINNVNFEKNQKSTLQYALSTARKHNITFDLAVIAEQLEKNHNTNSYKIYMENQDVFEVVANGLTHMNPLDITHRGEFRDITDEKAVSSDIQETHIKKMQLIFKKYDLLQGQKIFIVPWHVGDDNTISISDKYGYKMIVQTFAKTAAQRAKNIDVIVSDSFLEVPAEKVMKKDQIEDFLQRYSAMINESKKIQIVTFPINFTEGNNLEELISRIMSIKNENGKILYGFISETLKKE